MEDWIEVAVKAGGGAITAALAAWVLRPASPRARREAGLRHLEYPPAFKGLFVLMTAIVVGIGWALAARAPIGPEDAGYAVGLGAAAFIILAMFGYVAFVFRISWDDNFIHLRTLRHWNRRIPWDAVRKVEYRSGWQAWHVKTAKAGTIWIYRYQNGHTEFLDTARDKVARAVRS